MTYTYKDAELEFTSYIEMAVETRDVEAARIIRDQFAREDNQEQAEYWDGMARTWEREDNYHDEIIGN